MSLGPTIAPGDVAIRVAAALVCGLIIGAERERLERAAGMRTHALVAVSTALITIVSAFGFSDAVTATRTSVLDPSRVAAQIVSGIGFLGAGVIIFRKDTVLGLTTAASIWAVAAVGMACGSALYWAAGAVTFIILFLQLAVRPLEYRVFAHHRPHTFALRISREPGRMAAIERVVAASGIPLRGFRLRPDAQGNGARLEVALGSTTESAVLQVLERLGEVDGVRSISYRRTRLKFSFNGHGNGPTEEQDDAGEDDPMADTIADADEDGSAAGDEHGARP